MTDSIDLDQLLAILRPSATRQLPSPPQEDEIVVSRHAGFVDIHCHLLPNIDDGAQGVNEALSMATLAVEESIQTVVVTPHQLGNYAHNLGQTIRDKTIEFRQLLADHQVPLNVLPGADVRIEDGVLDQLTCGEVLTLGDHGKHVLLELPHELYFPLEVLLRGLRSLGMVGILSHPERNQGLLSCREPVERLVDAGCLMQVTAGSLTGTFGSASQELAEWALRRGLVHFVSTDAHGARSRRPLLKGCYHRVAELTDGETAHDLFSKNPWRVSCGQAVPSGRRAVVNPGTPNWFGFGKAVGVLKGSALAR